MTRNVASNMFNPFVIILLQLSEPADTKKYYFLNVFYLLIRKITLNPDLDIKARWWFYDGLSVGFTYFKEKNLTRNCRL